MGFTPRWGSLCVQCLEMDWNRIQDVFPHKPSVLGIGLKYAVTLTRIKKLLKVSKDKWLNSTVCLVILVWTKRYNVTICGIWKKHSTHRVQHYSLETLTNVTIKKCSCMSAVCCLSLCVIVCITCDLCNIMHCSTPIDLLLINNTYLLLHLISWWAITDQRPVWADYAELLGWWHQTIQF